MGLRISPCCAISLLPDICALLLSVMLACGIMRGNVEVVGIDDACADWIGGTALFDWV
jgi:hypothetical protein